MNQHIDSPYVNKSPAFSKMALMETKNSLTETIGDTSNKRKRGRPRKNNVSSICDYDSNCLQNRFTDFGEQTNDKSKYYLRNKNRI